MAEDASTHAAVVFAVPKGEGGLARVTCVHMQIVHPGVWQSWSYIHILEAVWEVILFSCRIPRFAKSLVDKVMGEPRPNLHVFWCAHVFQLDGVVFDQCGKVFSALFAGEVFHVLVHGPFE